MAKIVGMFLSKKLCRDHFLFYFLASCTSDNDCVAVPEFGYAFYCATDGFCHQSDEYCSIVENCGISFSSFRFLLLQYHIKTQ